MASGENTNDWYGVNNRKWFALCDQVVKLDYELNAHYETIRKYTPHVSMVPVEWVVTM